MDPLTHALVGGMAAKTVGASKRRFWVMMFLGCAPDLDVVFNTLGGWSFWLQHRGISHSLLGLVVQTVFYTWLFRKWDQGPFTNRLWHYALPLGLHSLCDFATSFGVPLLSPFAFRDYSADLMGGVALFPIIFMSFGLFRMVRNDSSGWTAARPLWAGWILYLMMSVSGKAYAAKLMEPHQGAVTTLPSVANPFVWTAIESDSASWSYKQYKVNLFNGAVKPGVEFSKPEKEGPVQSSLQSDEVRRFLKNTRWPVSRVLSSGEGAVVEWGNLLFSTRGFVRGKIRVEIDKQGHVIGDEKIFNFWNPPSV